MATTTRADTVALKQLTYLAGELKAARIIEAANRLGDHARDAGWTPRSTSPPSLTVRSLARNASDGPATDQTVGFAAMKTLEEFA